MRRRLWIDVDIPQTRGLVRDDSIRMVLCTALSMDYGAVLDGEGSQPWTLEID